MTTEIVFLIIMGIISILSMVSNMLNDRLIKEQKIMIDLQDKELKRVYEFNDEINIYCLERIMINAVEVENFEAAAKCKELIQKLKYPTP